MFADSFSLYKLKTLWVCWSDCAVQQLNWQIILTRSRSREAHSSADRFSKSSIRLAASQLFGIVLLLQILRRANLSSLSALTPSASRKSHLNAEHKAACRNQGRQKSPPAVTERENSGDQGLTKDNIIVPQSWYYKRNQINYIDNQTIIYTSTKGNDEPQCDLPAGQNQPLCLGWRRYFTSVCIYLTQLLEELDFLLKQQEISVFLTGAPTWHRHSSVPYLTWTRLCRTRGDGKRFLRKEGS